MEKNELGKHSIGQSLTVQLQIADFNHDRIWQTVFAQLQVGLTNRVFSSKYQLNVPSKERMTEFLRKENEGLYSNMQKITSAIFNDSKIHNSLIIGRVSYPPQAKIAEVIFCILHNKEKKV